MRFALWSTSPHWPESVRSAAVAWFSHTEFVPLASAGFVGAHGSYGGGGPPELPTSMGTPGVDSYATCTSVRAVAVAPMSMLPQP